MITGDGLIFDRASEFIKNLPEGRWILGDSAFAIHPGRVERRRKKNENLPSDPNRAHFQLHLDRFCSKVVASYYLVKFILKYLFFLG